MALGFTITEEQDIAGGVIIGAYLNTERIGMLWLTGEWAHLDGGRFVRLIEVEPEYRRRGVATALWDYAVENGFKPRHDASKTSDGMNWASTVDCKCPSCAETNVYARGYCQECFDQGCPEGEGHK